MATFVLTQPTIHLGGVDLTDVSNQVSLSYESEAQDATTFGNAGTRINKGGLFVLSAEVSGFTDPEAVGSTLFDRVGGANSRVFTVTDTGTDGGSGMIFRSMTQSRQPLSGSVGDMAAANLSLAGKSGDPLVSGTVLHDTSSAETATGTGTARQVGAVASGESVYAALQVVAASGTSPTLDVTVQSDDASGFASPTTRLTFTQQTSTGAEWQSAAGAITDDWWRVSFTIGGTSPSFTFGVVLGIR